MHFFSKFYRPRCYKTDGRNVCQMLHRTQLLALRLEEVSQFVRNFVTLRYENPYKGAEGKPLRAFFLGILGIGEKE